jgi:hypothetical protein
MNERQEKIQHLSRRNRGRIALPSFLAALGGALESNISPESLLSLRDTDAYSEALRSGYQSATTTTAVAFRRSFNRDEAQSFFKLVDCFASQISDEQVVFLTRLSDVCGAILLGAEVLLRHTQAVIAFDGDSLGATSTDKQQGLLLDLNSDDPEQFYEVAVWGDRWALLILACA